MKQKFTFIILVCTFLNFSIGQNIDPMEVFNQALKIAVEKDKNIFILFYDDNCEECALFISTLKDPLIADELNENFAFCYFKVDNKDTRDVLIELSGINSGLPFFVIMDKEAVVLANSKSKFGTNIGYPIEQFSKDMFRERVINNAKRLSEEQKDKWRAVLFK